jgi:hypothetical protein
LSHLALAPIPILASAAIFFVLFSIAFFDAALASRHSGATVITAIPFDPNVISSLN